MIVAIVAIVGACGGGDAVDTGATGQVPAGPEPGVGLPLTDDYPIIDPVYVAGPDASRDDVFWVTDPAAEFLNPALGFADLAATSHVVVTGRFTAIGGEVQAFDPAIGGRVPDGTYAPEMVVALEITGVVAGDTIAMGSVVGLELPLGDYDIEVLRQYVPRREFLLFLLALDRPWDSDAGGELASGPGSEQLYAPRQEGIFQELDGGGITSPIAGFNWMVEPVEQSFEEIAAAIATTPLAPRD